MGWVTTAKLQDYTNRAIAPILKMVRELKIFSKITIDGNEDDYWEAGSTSDVLPFINGNGVAASVEDDGIKFAAKIDGKTLEYNTSGQIKEKRTIITDTLTVANWSNKEYSFEVIYPADQYDIDVELNGDSATADQYNAWASAKLVGEVASNKIKALGTVPTVAIPVVLVVKQYA